jgi:SecD/SecF fusion protein
MKKSQGIIVLLLSFLLLVGISYVAFFGIGESQAGSAKHVKQGLDLAGGVSITYEVVGDEKPSDEDMNDTIYKLKQRVEKYSTEAQVYQEGSNRINIEIPGVSDADAVLTELGQPGTLYFIAETDADGNANYTFELLSGYGLTKSLDELKENGSIVLLGTDVETAVAATQQDQLGNSSTVVSLKLTTEGTQKFADATQKAFAANESIGIYYDGVFISVPGVDAVISNGEAVISGMEDFAAAEKLASQIRIGGLKLELSELRSNVVGAQLGEEAISTSLKAAVIGLSVVALLMLLVYLLPGFTSVIALLYYVALMIIMLVAFEITLTLPGIAGIILSIGMAVDANVIIYNRIREEIATGKTVKSSIKIGYQKALSAIVDGNITTLIAAVVLGIMGTGSIRGFAQTLGLGIVLSMFTALVVSRLILNACFVVGLQSEKLYGVAKSRKIIDFVGKRKVFFSVSVAVILCGIIVMGIYQTTSGNALNYNLEFKGGTSTSVTFEEDYSIAELESEVIPVIVEITKDATIQKQKVQGSNEVIFKGRTLDQTEREAITTALTEKFGVDEDKVKMETISSTISNEMKTDALLAIAVASFFMLIYIWVRFKDIRFGASSVMALIHDVLVVVAFYAVARVAVGNTFIACILTIVGYSVNATIIIFDRIRENLAEMKKKDTLADIVNLSITQTLNRCIYTSLTTFIMVAALYVLGVASVKEFALPLMIGIICGTYSSILITGPLWYVLRMKFVKKDVE